ncbi:hypothetical protein BDN67DRAFT_985285 [Paxillus ammoniavirescens]|nr:hypothetical protein BDN67DRAFT_985285 [Paxillus ammoniavirescens]
MCFIVCLAFGLLLCVCLPLLVVVQENYIFPHRPPWVFPLLHIIKFKLKCEMASVSASAMVCSAGHQNGRGQWHKHLKLSCGIASAGDNSIAFAMKLPVSPSETTSPRPLMPVDDCWTSGGETRKRAARMDEWGHVIGPACGSSGQSLEAARNRLRLGQAPELRRNRINYFLLKAQMESREIFTTLSRRDLV